MKLATHFRAYPAQICLGLIGVASVLAGTAHARVLCETRSGLVVVREQCRKHETPLNVSLGAGGASPYGSDGDIPLQNWASPQTFQPSASGDPSGLGKYAAKAAAVGDFAAPQAVAPELTGPLPLVAVSPCRLIDTRPGAPSAIAGDDIGPIGANVQRTYTLVGSCGIPIGAEAVSLNIVAVNTTNAGFLTAAPGGSIVQPVNTSTLNWNTTGQLVANAAIVPLNTNGEISIFVNQGANVIVDTNGYFASKCPIDSVRSGTGCMDKYEASVWRVPGPTTTNAGLVRKIQMGTATTSDLTAGAATQLGVGSDNYAPCNDNGSACTDIFAVSVAGVKPSASITWFQAVEACGNSQKRLPSNAEWQKAVTNTPDPGPDNGTSDCHTGTISAVPVNTGSRSACVSSAGAFDMVGNLGEWVADWVPASTACSSWGGFSNDLMCLAGASTVDTGPGALLRGGDFGSGSPAGPLAVFGFYEPSLAFGFVGFRCAR